MNGAESLFGSSAGSVAAIALLLAVLALGGVVLLLARQQRLLGQYQQLMTGSSGANLEIALEEHLALVRATAARVEAMEQVASRLENEAQFNVKHVSLVRFNPFRDTGGDQSFAVAVANGHGNGLVLSSLHARDTTRMYAKTLEDWQSSHPLTDEEKQAIDLARQ